MRHKKANTRPYVGDVGNRPQGPLDKAITNTAFVLLAIAVGFLIGFAVYAVMNLSFLLTDLIWKTIGGKLGFWWFPLVTCTIGGVVIGVWTSWSHDRVHSLEEVMKEFKETGNYKTKGVVKPVVTFLLPLMFGGSIGFEAGLTGLITAGCCWIRDRLKAAGLRVGTLADVSIAASLTAIFRTPLVGIVAGEEADPEQRDSQGRPLSVADYDMRRKAKIVLYMAAAFGAFGGIQLFSALFGVSGGLPRFDKITASGTRFIWVIPCIALAYVMTLLFHGSNRLFGIVSERMGEGRGATVAKPVICGILMGGIACMLPYVLFPGETQSEELMETWTTWTALALVSTGVLKAAVTPMCLNMGWSGGNFFPSIFAGVAAGYGIAALTGADPMLMVTVTASAFLAGVLRKPLVVLAVLFLCFPMNGILWMGLGAVVGASLPVPSVLLKGEE